jgi:hypothetical protein
LDRRSRRLNVAEEYAILNTQAEAEEEPPDAP